MSNQINLKFQNNEDKIRFQNLPERKPKQQQQYHQQVSRKEQELKFSFIFSLTAMLAGRYNEIMLSKF